MNKRLFFAITAMTAAVSLGVAVYRAWAAPRVWAQTVAQAPTQQGRVDLLPAAGASAIVDAANAFLTTLTPQQRAAVQVELSASLAGRWSNFPAAVVPRNGLFFRDLTPAQTEAALKVARLALSADGYTRLLEVRAADDAFGQSDEAKRGPGGRGGRGPGGPPPNGQGGSPLGGSGVPGGGPGGFGSPAQLFGNGNYIIAFLGKPSKTTPWLLQLGGHHAAFNLYYKGATGTTTPYFIGAQPNTWKDASGKTHAPLAPLRDALYNLTHSLTPSQQAQAKLGASFNDVYVGPGRDGKYPVKSEGVSVASLSPASKALVRRAIAAWTGDFPQSVAYRKRYDAELAQTTVSYSGSTALAATGDYVRIDGPNVWIEFACQGSDHYHTIWRDKATDYGAEFSF